jgi:hypothetical protein
LEYALRALRPLTCVTTMMAFENTASKMLEIWGSEYKDTYCSVASYI